MMVYTAEGKFDYSAAGTYELDGKHYKETCTYHSNWPEGIGSSLWFDWSKSAKGYTLYFSGFKKSNHGGWQRRNKRLGWRQFYREKGAG